eukprot:TRINITY_DN10564_c0_g2_i2.p1 TRINITY_DN10564_c0_g2~~TRINITY_DN10564_c0_g2_i2.p1  ORF type:complete len:276 (-),score=45.27 TRINITY_DN10564_c0_g2_i2:33-755(-)
MDVWDSIDAAPITFTTAAPSPSTSTSSTTSTTSTAPSSTPSSRLAALNRMESRALGAKDSQDKQESGSVWLTNGLQKVLEECEQLSDITFVVQGMPIQAHKAILSSRSAYFRSMLGGALVESQQTEILFDNFSVEVFMAILQYIYTDRIDFFIEMLPELLSACAELQLVSLLDLLESFLISRINESNLCSLFHVSTYYQLPLLRESCLKILGDRLKNNEFISDVSSIDVKLISMLKKSKK